MDMGNNPAGEERARKACRGSGLRGGRQERTPRGRSAKNTTRFGYAAEPTRLLHNRLLHNRLLDNQLLDNRLLEDWLLEDWL